eukprot:CAMPEP_0119314332 /NCGR_PEP_ID=MMETSP1333-20130426/32458_1 /TAXON_ID=418940 /ORGANISM="Scyphosphaera apsteinii, Strain RCC1455" /LENGTH=510 /DNA_ID=CAMNT_0007319425 /DNA_START=96 /DNA_END=1628 /DNA_ORIENTATION=+
MGRTARIRGGATDSGYPPQWGQGGIPPGGQGQGGMESFGGVPSLDSIGAYGPGSSGATRSGQSAWQYQEPNGPASSMQGTMPSHGVQPYGSVQPPQDAGYPGGQAGQSAPAAYESMQSYGGAQQFGAQPPSAQGYQGYPSYSAYPGQMGGYGYGMGYGYSAPKQTSLSDKFKSWGESAMKSLGLDEESRMVAARQKREKEAAAEAAAAERRRAEMPGWATEYQHGHYQKMYQQQMGIGPLPPQGSYGNQSYRWEGSSGYLQGQYSPTGGNMPQPNPVPPPLSSGWPAPSGQPFLGGSGQAQQGGAYPGGPGQVQQGGAYQGSPGQAQQGGAYPGGPGPPQGGMVPPQGAAPWSNAAGMPPKSAFDSASAHAPPTGGGGYPPSMSAQGVGPQGVPYGTAMPLQSMGQAAVQPGQPAGYQMQSGYAMQHTEHTTGQPGYPQQWPQQQQQQPLQQYSAPPGPQPAQQPAEVEGSTSTNAEGTISEAMEPQQQPPPPPQQHEMQQASGSGGSAH